MKNHRILCHLLFAVAVFHCDRIAAKCLPPTTIVGIRGSDGSWTDVQLASGYFGQVPLGHVHLADGDSLDITIWPDCPAAMWLIKDGIMIDSLEYAFQAHWRLSVEGDYSIGGDFQNTLMFWTGVTVSIDHDVSMIAPQTMVITALLGGALNGTQMRTDLWSAGLIPTHEPYSDMGYSFVGGGGEEISNEDLYEGGYPLVDWVVLELRDALDPTIIIHSRAAFLDAAGNVRDLDRSIVKVLVPPGAYYVAIKHRNHLGVMTAHPIRLVGLPPSVRFSWNPLTWGEGSMSLFNSWQHCLWPGNARSIATGNTVKYTGSSNDRDAIFLRLGSVVPTSTVSGYYPEDLNLDGVVKYTGVDNDSDLILSTIGGDVPTAVRTEQMP